MTRKQKNENKRTEILKKIWALIESEGDEVIQIKKNEIAFRLFMITAMNLL